MGQTAKKRYRFRQFEFWAHYGKIALLDTERVSDELNEVDAIIWLSPKEFMERAMAARALMIERYKGEGRKLLDDALACAKEAEAQGDISDPKILQQKFEEFRPVKVFFPSQPRLIVPGRTTKIIEKLRELRAKSRLSAEEVLRSGIPKEQENKPS